MIIDEKIMELFLEKYHNDYIHDNEETLTIDYNQLVPAYVDLIEEMEKPGKYHETIKQMERITKNRCIQDKNVKIKIHNKEDTIPLSELHQQYKNTWVSVEGMVKNRSNIRNMIVKAHWSCNVCGEDRIVKMAHGEKVTPPKGGCFRCEHRRGYTLNEQTTEFKDIQLLILQEPLDTIGGGFQPAETKVYLEDDLCDTVKPGDKVRINGVLKLQKKGINNLFSEYLTAEYVEQLEQDFEDITITDKEIQQIKEISEDPQLFDRIRQSTLPSVYGNDELKEAIALYLFGSDNIPSDEEHDYYRGDIHILLIGDPGVAKSQILKRVSTLAPRGIYTSGKGSSGAGLTATAVKDEFGNWSLEAGAMALADNGNICIDEFDKMREEDRSAIHEALEQQTISISKAGITTTLNSRCSVLAAANPKYGAFNPVKSIKEQITLSSTILSRFDFIFLLLDEPEPDRDMDIAMSILMQDFQSDDKIPFDLFRKYISYARKNIHPQLSYEVAKKLSEFYKEWRELATINNNPIPITARQLNAMSRLAKASARARLSPIVELEDAERAIRLQKYCLKRIGFDQETGTVNAAQAVGVTNGTKDIMNDERMNELVEGLFEEWGNSLPLHILKRSFKDKGLNDEAISKWIRNLDEDGKYFYETSEGVLTKL